MTIKQMRDQRAALAAKARALLDNNQGSKWNATISGQVDALYNEIDAIETRINATERFHALGGVERGNAWRNADTGEPIRVIDRNDAGNVRAALNADAPEGTMGDFLRAVAGMKAPQRIKDALSEGTDTAGGFGVPAWLLPDFIESLIPNASVLKAGAKILPLKGTAKSFTVARVNGVPTAGWRAEAGAVSESDPSFTALALVPKSLSFFFKVSRELLADSPNMDQMLQHAISQAFAKEFDRAALRGTGASNEPTGVSNTAGIAAVTNGANGAVLSSIKWTNLNAAYQAILDANGPTPTSVIMAPRSLVGFASMVDTTGQPLRRPGLLDPMQFIPTSAIPVNLTVGTSVDCSEQFVGDFTELVIGMREDFSVQRADQLFATNGQVAFICHARADVGVLHAASFAKITGMRAG